MGSGPSTVSTPPGILRRTVMRPSVTPTISSAYVICDSPSFSATCGPTWAVSPSMACRPPTIRSKSPILRIAMAKAYEVAKVSAPAKARSVRSTPSSAPR